MHETSESIMQRTKCRRVMKCASPHRNIIPKNIGAHRFRPLSVTIISAHAPQVHSTSGRKFVTGNRFSDADFLYDA